MHDWLREPWIDGGYSIAFLRKTVRLGRILHEGAGRLLIAGQHASFKYAGYMEGALESAQRASRRILDKCRSHPLQRNGD